MTMDAHKTLWPSDVWSAIELTAAKEGMTVSDVIRVGTLSYVSFLLARRQDESTLAFDDLWDSA
jgi:hypothetical protein